MKTSFKIISFIILGLILLVAVFYILNSYVYNEKQAKQEDPSIASFEACVEAGYPTLESYPEQCVTPSGKRFVRNLPESELEEVSGPITSHGTFVCLPHWNTEGPQTLECAIGFRDTFQNYYVLRDSASLESPIGSVPMNTSVTVTGNLIPGSAERYQSIGTIEVDAIVVWDDTATSTDNISFQYPETITTSYITLVDWPPQVQIIDEQFECTVAGDETDRAGSTREQTIGNTVYCITVTTEGAAGSVYRQYAYAFAHGDQTMIFTFSAQYPQCVNYDDLERTACEQEQTSFDFNSLVHHMSQSIEQS